jgi:predicted RNase H-like HicB family nuclease
MAQRAYAYVIERADDGAYWAYLPDLPGCTTTGDSAEAVERQLPEAVTLYLSYYRERGLADPEPHCRVGTLPAA